MQAELHRTTQLAGLKDNPTAPLVQAAEAALAAMVQANNVPDAGAQCQRRAVADKEGRRVCSMLMWADPKVQPNE